MKIDLLSMRAVLLSAAWLSLLWVGIDNGVVQELLARDETYISKTILLLFLYGYALVMYRTWECSNFLNNPHSAPSDPVSFSTRRDPIDLVSKMLIRLGLFGTVYGFLLATGDLSISALTSIETAGAELGGITKGISVAFVTTLTGLVTSSILTLHQRLLEGGYEKLYLSRVQQ